MPSRIPLRIWAIAARPRTLPAAVAPVLVGTALAGSEEAQEGRDAYREKRPPDFSRFPRRP